MSTDPSDPEGTKQGRGDEMEQDAEPSGQGGADESQSPDQGAKKKKKGLFGRFGRKKNMDDSKAAPAPPPDLNWIEGEVSAQQSEPQSAPEDTKPSKEKKKGGFFSRFGR
eukprot:CAMPEP_0168761592 /NCGR_PEP_ID=MMETSP0724-20121128/23401_1 /TAXON_ID=265536 /ORGANISM="Amphiprora sp., Strain CCMP467" /LENGTH=109 /DNA_ID=CAMNT_0008810717 /DNA_START=99 /DNA_END=423 /DNA_ORIENTATION=+